MPRVARVVIPGLPHHVTQRGNNRQEVFFTDDDRHVYLSLLGKQARRFGMRVEAYCLMTNHVHLVVVPTAEAALAAAVGRTHFLYTQFINRLHGRSGHLWQNRFFSCPTDDAHAYAAYCYVERNPVRARLVRTPWRYAWSSAAAHCAGSDPLGLLDLEGWRERVGEVDWREQLQDLSVEEVEEPLRRHTSTGRPLAGDSLLSKLEHQLNRRLRPLPIGRPRKEK